MSENEKFNDARQLLDLKDSVVIEGHEFLVSTFMMDIPKTIHGRKYWAESYLAEIHEGQVGNIKLIGQYLTLHDAVQGHKMLSQAITFIALRSKGLVEFAVREMLAPKKPPITAEEESNKVETTTEESNTQEPAAEQDNHEQPQAKRGRKK